MTPALLHNMSTPPRSTITVARARLAGQWIRIDTREVLKPAALSALRRNGFAAIRSLMDGTRHLHRGTVRSTRAEIENALTGRLRSALADARIPEQLGIFVDDCDLQPAMKAKGADWFQTLELGALLGVLCRRSGPIYLPRRPFQPSLIVPFDGYLFFPEVSDVAR